VADGGRGRYDFFTLSYDAAGNEEDPLFTPDASVELGI
jgi:hypothetical protein